MPAGSWWDEKFAIPGRREDFEEARRRGVSQEDLISIAGGSSSLNDFDLSGRRVGTQGEGFGLNETEEQRAARRGGPPVPAPAGPKVAPPFTPNPAAPPPALPPPPVYRIPRPGDTASAHAPSFAPRPNVDIPGPNGAVQSTGQFSGAGAVPRPPGGPAPAPGFRPPPVFRPPPGPTPQFGGQVSPPGPPQPSAEAATNPTAPGPPQPTTQMAPATGAAQPPSPPPPAPATAPTAVAQPPAAPSPLQAPQTQPQAQPAAPGAPTPGGPQPSPGMAVAPAATPVSKLPGPGDLDSLPPGGAMVHPMGTFTRGSDGSASLTLSAQGQQAYRNATVKAIQAFGAHPWANDPNAPKPPVQLGASNYNPITGQWTGGRV